MNTQTQTFESITVFGAANMDICGTPEGVLVPRDSNPGTIRTALGGVGRNIAHNLTLLGNRVRFISAIGEDVYGRQILDSLNALGIDTRECIIARDDPTSTYLYITREDGEMELAVNDMRIYRHMTPAFIAARAHLLSESALIVVDANLPAETLEVICRTSPRPVFAEPVSCAKARRLSGVLDAIHTVTPNLAEAEVLSGRAIDPADPASLMAAAEKLLRAGVKQVIITLGAKGCFFTDGSIARTLPSLPVNMVNGNGAGDALLSGFATGFCRGLSLEESVLLGMAAAGITLETPLTNSPALNYDAAWQRGPGRGAGAGN